MITTGPRGTKDILPDAISFWRYVEENARKVCKLFNYNEIRTPIFEHTELFLRGIGETTDIVEKEMYTFIDRGGRSITLRPENTAAVVRAYLENKLYTQTPPVKLFYIGPMFRYDRPQAGRYRQFHQFGVEAIGAKGPVVDAEIIMLAVEFLHNLGLKDLKLLINSVGCPHCRPIYREKLQGFLKDKIDDLCEMCRSRYDRNPMRILDCKNEKCQQLSEGAPTLIECLCDECQAHFEGLQKLLSECKVKFEVDTRLVRGLDYYTKTAFEIQYSPLGAQSAVCGGGRYDGLIAECGGEQTPGIGFAIGLERVMLALEKQNLLPEIKNATDIFIVSIGQEAQLKAFELLIKLRQAGISAEMDYMDKSIKAQMKQANKYLSRFVVIIGEDELNNNQVMLKDMQAGEQQPVKFEELLEKLILKVEK